MTSSSPFNLLCQFLLHRHLHFTLALSQHRAWCTAATPTTNPYHLWKEKEEEILRDIEPVVTLTKDILRSRRCILEGKMHHLGVVLYHFKTDGEGGDGVADAGGGVETEGDGAIGEYCGEPMGAVRCHWEVAKQGKYCMRN
ncbi:hypothetical protein HN51_040655 [Arachis hypogaea]